MRGCLQEGLFLFSSFLKADLEINMTQERLN